MQGDSLKKASQMLFIIDYDIPRRPSARRRAFYRDLARLKEEMGLFGKMSTMSVIITLDRELAERIYRLASQYGEANIYVGRKMDGEVLHDGKEAPTVTRGTLS